MLNWLKQRLGFNDMEVGVSALRGRLEQLREEVDTLASALAQTVERTALESESVNQKLDAIRDGVTLMEHKAAGHNFAQAEKLVVLGSHLDSFESRVRLDNQELPLKVISIVSRQLQDKLGQSLILVSPNGKQRISLVAGDTVSGIWITGQSGEPIVALYKTTVDDEGAVVGVYGPADEQGHRRGGLDACFYYATSGDDPGGAIQMLTADNRPQLLELALGEYPDNFVKPRDKKYVGCIPPDIAGE